MKKIAMVFSRPFEGNEPLSHIGTKLPTYLKLLDLLKAASFEPYVASRKVYRGRGIFEGAWKYEGEGRFEIIHDTVKIDLIFDRVGGLKFPLTDDSDVVYVNIRSFKEFCADKWAAYQDEILQPHMPQTVWIGDTRSQSKEAIFEAVSRLKSDKIVLKPHNGLKGLGIYVGPKHGAKSFEYSSKYPSYIAQYFVDTSGGIPGIADFMHDLRIVVLNGEVVWCHVRTPAQDSLTANVAAGGSLTEIDYEKVPNEIKKIMEKIIPSFVSRFDNPLFSVDFGMQGTTPFIFEINDQIGFPHLDMKKADKFLNALVSNFVQKLS